MDAVFPDLKPEAVITRSGLEEQAKDLFGDTERIDIDCIGTSVDAEAQAAVFAQRARTLDADLLYVLFTSGSTGTPKGASICHQSVIDYIEAAVKAFGVSETDVFGNQHPFYFDGSVWDVYAPLKLGATLEIIPEKLFAWPIRLLEYLVARKVTTIHWVPTAYINLSKLNALKNFDLSGQLKTIVVAGEVMPNKHLNYWRRHIPNARYINLYGPTEITVGCTYYIVDRPFADDEPLPIGNAFPNVEVLVLGEDDRLITDASGGKGELCVRGTSLSRGYYRNPEKTKEAFVQNPLNDAYPELIYRTGDLVKYNERGEIMYLSRKDFQIKHYGYRIELGEIETAVSSIPEIAMNCCLYDQKRSKIVLFAEGDLELPEIQERIKTLIPDYMQPNRLVRMQKMPLNANGKIDREKLKELI